MNKKICFFFILFYHTHFLQAQNWQSGFLSFDFYYGKKILSSGDFYRQLPTTQNLTLNKPPNFIGIGYSGKFLVVRSFDYSGHLSYCQIIPEEIIVADTIKTKISGSSFSTIAYLGIDLFGFSQSIDFLLGFGFNTGRLRLYGNEWVRQKNPFFSPKISLQPRFKLGKLVLAFRADYEYDISKKGWRRTLFANKDKINLSPLKQTGFTVLAGIGFVIK